MMSFIDDGNLIAKHLSIIGLQHVLIISNNMLRLYLKQAVLYCKGDKYECQYFYQGQEDPSVCLNLDLGNGVVIKHKHVWQYLSFFFNCKLLFREHASTSTRPCLPYLKCSATWSGVS